MLTSQYFFRSVALTLSLAAFGLTGSRHSRLAENAMAMDQIDPKQEFTLPPPPQDPGAPVGRREGGSSRGKKIFALCQSVAEVASQKCATARLTALVPEISDKKQVWGLTTAEHPEFLFYLSKFRDPRKPDTANLPIEFVLQDENDQYIYKTRFVLPLTDGGIIRLPLPTTSPPLEIGKRYTWTLFTHFHPSETNFVQGTISRTRLTPQRQKKLQTASPLQRLDILLQEGLWFDAVSTLLELKQADPRDLKLASKWTRLLHDINLKELATEPMLPCCTPEPQASLR